MHPSGIPAHDPLRFAEEARERFAARGARADADKAVELYRWALPRAVDQYSLIVIGLHLVDILSRRFEHFGDRADIDEAITLATQLFDDSTDDGDRAAILGDLGNALRTRFAGTGDPLDLDRGIDTLMCAISTVPDGDPARRLILINAADALRTRFQHAGDHSDLTEAVRLAREANQLITPDDAHAASLRNGLAVLLVTRFEHLGDPADLDEAIAIHRRNIATHPSSSVVALINLALALLSQFEQTPQADIDEAVRLGRQAMKCPASPDQRAAALAAVGMCLSARFARFRRSDDLDESIELLRAAVDGCAANSRDFPSHCSNLADALWTRFIVRGSRGDLDDAVAAGRAAIGACPQNAPGRVSYLTNLGNALRTRHAYTGSIPDLREAIACDEEAVEALPPGHPGLAARLTNLAISLSARFEHEANPVALELAIEVMRDAVDHTPAGDSDRSTRLSNLLVMLTSKVEREGDTTALRETLTVGRKALSSAASSAQGAAVSSNLARALVVGFKTTGSAADLDEAIALYRSAVAGLDSEIHAVTAQLGLAAALHLNANTRGDDTSYEEAVALWQAISTQLTAPASARLQAARAWGSATAAREDWARAAEGYAVATDLLPLAAWRGLDQVSREQHLVDAGTVAADAAACALHLGRPEWAVELLEGGRGVLWEQVVAQRGDLSRLREAHPRLADQLDLLRERLDYGGPADGIGPLRLDGVTVTGAAARDDRMRAALDWDATLTEIRGHEGFRHFLVRVPLAELMPPPGTAPVVIVNVSGYGCHALVVSADVTVVDLPDLLADEVATRATSLLTVLDRLRRGALPPRVGAGPLQHVVFTVMEWLWDTVTEPILSSLGYETVSDDVWPHLHWCLVGRLAVLPVHAAGYQRPGSGRDRTVLDRVVSSYVPSLRALSRARRAVSTVDRRALVVAVPDAPDMPELPDATAEAEVVTRHLSCEYSRLVGSAASRESVLADLGRSAYAHFACHGVQDLSRPSEGAIVLHDGALTIFDIARLRLDDAEMIFVSACRTASAGTLLPNEAIHLAAALQVAGYRHVIATLWAIGERSAIVVAEQVYTMVAAPGRLEPDRAAWALNRAVRSLRESAPGTPTAWLPYVHLGPCGSSLESGRERLSDA
ncbi:CHAT domain-containing protein [Nonomuraea sp. NPDC050022]|uniref:CHAT domain-containing protein n=1 Tax=Nonomuraea sp. NPDC050022 TaxID=3364358 RepID=UPI0037B55D22